MESVPYFFTNFSKDWGYEQLWRMFKKYDRVYEIYYPKKRDKFGRHFRFMRFNEVKEATTLEKLLDSILIGDQKLHVNRPRFGRGEKDSNDRTVGWKMDSRNKGYLRKISEQNRKQSYAEVVKNGGIQERKKETKHAATEQGTVTKERWIWRKKKKLEIEWSGMTF